MDNVTHTLAGLLLAESASQLRLRLTGVESSPRFRTTAAVVGAIAANFPDSDLLYTGIGADRLSYMLQHRGYTHTVVVAVLSAFLLWALTIAWWRWRARANPDRADSTWTLGLVMTCMLSHLALDWTNSYGVHLFWPFDNRWRYGDFVFIIEPWLWVVSIPALFFASQRRLSRVLLSLALGAVLAVAWRVSFVSTGTAIALTAGSVISIFVSRALLPGPRAGMAVAGWVLVTLVMAAGATAARLATLQAMRSADMTSQILDVVVSPLPANPFCASVITVERSRRSYRVMTARVSAAPNMTPASLCRSRDDAAPAFVKSSRPSTAAVQWDREWSAPAIELRVLARESCPARAALRFLRVPVWIATRDSSMILGDARYGGGSGSSFSDVTVPSRSAACPAGIPPWTPPRTDVIGGG